MSNSEKDHNVRLSSNMSVPECICLGLFSQHRPLYIFGVYPQRLRNGAFIVTWSDPTKPPVASTTPQQIGMPFHGYLEGNPKATDTGAVPKNMDIRRYMANPWQESIRAPVTR